MPEPVFQFTILARDGCARQGRIVTAHGAIDTPAFMAVGTHGAVKGLTVPQLHNTGTPVMLVNAFHMAMRPGGERVERLGGLHAFTGWHGPILTDSGGFQVFSLADLREIDDDGAVFRSPVSGKRFRFTPESVMDMEAQLGADIVMQFDECAPYPCDKDIVARAMRRSLDWANRAAARFDAVRKPHQVLFPIVQGGVHDDLRRESVDALAQLHAPGYGIGGLSVGEGAELMMHTLKLTASRLPDAAPRYLMGVGRPEDLIRAVARGVDMFDCVMPTRNARNAYAFTWNGPIKIRNARFADDTDPIDATCPCPACRYYSRATIRHFFMEKIMTGEVLLTLHNLTFYQQLTEAMRDAIRRGFFSKWADDTLKELAG